MATIFIGGFYSRCGECGRNADPRESHHIMETMVGEGCGAEFTEEVYTYAQMVESKPAKACSLCKKVGGPWPNGDRPKGSGMRSGCPRCGWCY